MRALVVTLSDLQLNRATMDRLLRAANDVSASENPHLLGQLPLAASAARSAAEHWDFGAPSRAVENLLFPILGPLTDETTRARLRRAAVARLALDHFEIQRPLPASVMALFPEHFARLARYLTEGPGDRYVDEFFAKDVRYALCLTIPCGALQMDLGYRIGPKLLFRDILAARSVRSVLSYVACNGWGRWGNDHIDLRAMKEFDLAGWTASLARMSDVLELNEDLKGVAGVSWFYDPELGRISPSLAHLQQVPLRHGAFLIRMATTEDDIKNATIRSHARRVLYEKGDYRPARYLLAWPRTDLIAWAKGSTQVATWRSVPQEARLVITAARNS
jgi:hypothetical protein